MENIIIIPENNKQSSVIQAFLKEMNIHFKVKDDNTKMSKEAFMEKLDAAKQQVREGKTKRLTSELKKELFKSVL